MKVTAFTLTVSVFVGIFLFMLIFGDHKWFTTEEPLVVQYAGCSKTFFPQNFIKPETLFIIATNKMKETILIQSNNIYMPKEMKIAILSLKRNDLIHVKLYCYQLGNNYYYDIKELTIIPSGKKLENK